MKVSDWLGHYDASGSFPVEPTESHASSPVSVNSEGMMHQYPGENDRGQNDSVNQVSLQEKEHQSIPSATSSSMFPVDVSFPSSLISSTDTPTDSFRDSLVEEEGDGEGEEKSDSLPKESSLSQSFFDTGSPSSSFHADQSNIHDMTSSFHVTPAVSSLSQRTFQERQKVMQDRSLMYKQFKEETGEDSSPDMSEEDRGISTSESITALNSGSERMDFSETNRNDDLNSQVESVHYNNTIPVVHDTSAQNRAKTDYLSHSPLAKHDAFDSVIHSYSYLYGQGPDRSDGRLHAFETTDEYHFPTSEIGKSKKPESATSGTASTPFLITRYVTPPSAGQSSSSSRVSPKSASSSPAFYSGSNKHKGQAELRQLRHRYQKKSILSSMPSYMFSSSLFYPSTSHHRRSLHYDEHNRPQYRVYLAPNDYHYSSSSQRAGYSGKKRIPVSLPRSGPSLKSLYSFPPPSKFLSTSYDTKPLRYSSSHSRSSTTNPKASKSKDHSSVATLNIYSYRGEDPSSHPSHNYEFDLKATPRGQGAIDLCVGHECNHRKKQSIPVYYPKRRFEEELASPSHPTEIIPEMSEDVTDTLNDSSEYLSLKELLDLDKTVYKSSDVIESIVRPRDHPWYTSPYD